MAKRMDIDLLKCSAEKMVINEQKYPAERVKGKALKYSEYE